MAEIWKEQEMTSTPCSRMSSATMCSDNDAFLWKQLHLSKAKLKASSRTSGLMSGFAMVAMVEISLGEGNHIPDMLCIMFSVITTILISVHVFALMISVCILPNIEAIEQLKSDNVENGIKVLPCDSPHKALRNYVEVAWMFSTGLGTLLFLLEIPMLIWVKFYNLSKAAVYASMGIMVPVCVIFLLFAVRFYRKLVEHKNCQSEKGIEELHLIATQVEACD